MIQRVTRNREKLIKLFEKNPPNFSEGKFRGVRVAGGVFRNINFERADFRDADLRETDFAGVSFESANFTQANFFKACLQNTNLAGAQLSGANLQEADFNGADLTLAVINEADFTNARNLTQEQIDACVFIKDNDVSNKNPPILPEGLKPSFAVMTGEEWRSLEDQREILAVRKESLC